MFSIYNSAGDDEHLEAVEIFLYIHVFKIHLATCAKYKFTNSANIPKYAHSQDTYKERGKPCKYWFPQTWG
jgi:hypothetical protein